jgi:hypothetical protein
MQGLGYSPENLGSIPERAIDFPSSYRVQTDPGAHPSSCPVGTLGFFPLVKWTGREADHLLSSGIEVDKGWSYTSAPHKP